jgi:hypothetical protein
LQCKRVLCGQNVGAAFFDLTVANQSLIEGKPEFGDCWWVLEKYIENLPNWRSSQAPEHPVVVVGAVRPNYPLVLCVPRSTKEPEEAEEPWTVFTPKGQPPNLEKDGWLLVQCEGPVQVSAFKGFTSTRYAGRLDEEYVTQLRQRLKLPKPI